VLTIDALRRNGCPVCNRRSFAELPEKHRQDEILWRWEKAIGRKFGEETYERHCRGAHNELRRVRCDYCAGEFFLPMLQGDKAFYATVVGSEADYYVQGKWEFDHAIKQLKAAGARRILDYGSGGGAFLNQAISTLPSVDAYGYDLGPKPIDRAAYKAIDKVTLDAIDGELLDAIVMMQVLEHLEKPAEELRNVVPLLRPGGIVIVAVPNADGPTALFPDAVTNLPPHHLSRWRIQTLEKLGEACGLTAKVIRAEPLSRYLWRSYLPAMIANALPRRLVRPLFASGLIDVLVFALLLLPFKSLPFLRGHSAIAIFVKP
jgi:SAM-dependent methyltransferase